jgi:hypothetical protein
LDLEEEKIQNRLLERAVERLQQEIDKTNIYRSGSTGFAKDVNLPNNGEIAEACGDGFQISEDEPDEESVKTLLEIPHQLVLFPSENEVIGVREELSSDDQRCIQQYSDEVNDVVIIEDNDQLSPSDLICIQQHSDEENGVIDHNVNAVNSQLVPQPGKEVGLHS